MLSLCKSFVPSYGIFLCGYTTFWLLIHQLVNIWVVSTLWLLEIMLL